MLDALRKVEQSAPDPARPQAPSPQTRELFQREPAKSVPRGWLSRRKAREAARRAEAAARHAAVVERLDALELQLRQLDETVTKQLGELEPRLLHAFELRAQGLERELGSLLRSATPALPAEPPRPAWEDAGLASFAVLGLRRLLRRARQDGTHHT